ncbi:hypothetical protein Poli38472_013157 [Pythium oligandrum]|uniref:Uncharacterized protein n=1 Tax=Pythium oligandrum TaxID=41045 RepID=A0A8K1C2I2_PYTOL|nr:hypothetical protein Poli38472_013157 [Pythium oligandrum]|eukprot:TMW55266.1 hypothetical protein Poli38472_013157 [Pythium oligandrum]
MVAGKQHYSHASSTTRGTGACEIRSGMSVQDLKQLTAQRAQRQRMEFWEQQARNSPRQPMQHDWSPSSSTSSTSGSPMRNYGGYNGYSASRRSPSTSPSGSERMFVTYGGQIVSFMEGVVNVPQVDYFPESLSPL